MQVKVLLVDDSDIVCSGLEKMLTEIDGVSVVGKAKDVQGAVESISKMKPDVVILDIRLLNGSGIDVLKDIKKKKPSPVVLMLTNYPYPQYQQKCMELGADYFLDKVTEIEKIPDIISSLRKKFS